MINRISATLSALIMAVFLSGGASAQTNNSQSADDPNRTYTTQEIIDAGHSFFGKTTGGLADAIESVFSRYGRPNAYIIGEEAAGSFVGGVRYGEGNIHPKSGGKQRIYWQGPSIGFDFGGNGSRVLTLIYNMGAVQDLYQRIAGIEGSAYVVGGFGINFQQRNQLVLAPIRTGVGARLGINIGYLKYTAEPTWNPF